LDLYDDEYLPAVTKIKKKKDYKNRSVSGSFPTMLKKLIKEEEFELFLQNNSDKLILIKFFTV